jgi:hypothetical protein
VSYHLDLSEQIRLGMVDPDEPADAYAEWGFDVGRDDGRAGGVSREGKDALTHPKSRPHYIEGYTEGGCEMRALDLSGPSYGASLEGAGEMFMPRDHDHYGWTDTYTRGAS